MNIFIIGTRAQLIKVAPVIRIFEINQAPITFIMTGQHNDTMQDLIKEFQISTKPIELIKNTEHSSIFSLLLWMPKVFNLLSSTLNKYDSGYVFVHGDTLTTLLSTIAGKRTKKKIVHLESGLTSKSLLNPFPEEIIRRIVFKYTDIAFCPTLSDIENLKKYPRTEKVYTHGNTILDSIQHLCIGENIEQCSKTILVSLHRFQNIYNQRRLQDIVTMLLNLSTKFQINFVLHPATKKKLVKFDLLKQLEDAHNIQLLARMTYKTFLNLALSSEVVITDGGSNQEELSFFGHPTIILRETTERQDGLLSNALLIEEPNKVQEYLFQDKHLELKKPKKTLGISPSSIILNKFTKINSPNNI